MGIAAKKRKARKTGKVTGAKKGAVGKAVLAVLPPQIQIPARIVGMGVQAVQKFLPGRTSKAAALAAMRGRKKRRRSIVPKAVRKYVNRMVRKRKQENKIVSKLLMASGAKRMFGGTRRGSRGVITSKEALAALGK